MSVTGLDVFDRTLEKTVVWLNELMDETGWQDRHLAYTALRAVLHGLRDRLTAEEAVDLGAQLPMLVRGFYYEGWRPAGRPFKYRHKEEFLQHVGRELPSLEEPDVETAARAVFKLLADHVTAGEIGQVRSQLPEDVRALWP